MHHHAPVALYALSAGKSWEPVGDGQWITAKTWTEGGILRIAVSESEHFDENKIILSSKITKSSQWVLVSEDFAEIESKDGTRYGMYFESESDAVDFTVNITIGLTEIEKHPQPPPLPKSLQTVAEVPSVDEKENEPVSPLSAGTLHSREPLDARVLSFNSTNSRRKSLALFKEIDDAMGDAFSHPIISPTGTLEANFPGAVTAQIIAIGGRDRAHIEQIENVSQANPPPAPRRTSQIVETASCFPTRKNSDAPPMVGIDSISAPLAFKHAVKVTFNKDLSRFEGLPPEWSFQNQQFGVPLEQLPKRNVEGYSHGLVVLPCCSNSHSIPTVLVMLKRHLFENNGHYTVGIFRLAPDKDDCQRIKTQINTGTYEGTTDVNILANLIKVFFRELPVNLFNTLGDDVIHKVARMSIDETIHAMESVLEGKNGALIYWLLDLMAEVVVYEDTNKMSARNMAIVLSPNLYAVNSENAMVALTMAQKVAEFTTNLLSARLKNKYHYEPRSS